MSGTFTTSNDGTIPRLIELLTQGVDLEQARQRMTGEGKKKEQYFSHDDKVEPTFKILEAKTTLSGPVTINRWPTTSGSSEE